MTFQESVEYLLSLGNEVSAMKLGLESIRKLLAALGNPEKNYLKIQVAGTNGKGSVCAFLDSICLKAEIKTGRFTSPHLVSITERVKIGGEDISDTDFARYSTRVRETSERLMAAGTLEAVPTYFEQVTAIALIAFAEANVKLAILETGLGGRLDATTAVNAEIAAITRIDLDHQEYLGRTIEEIAAEKAAIIRADSRVVMGEQSTEAAAILQARCGEFGVVPLTLCEVIDRTTDMVNRGPVVSFRTERDQYGDLVLGLKGRHQVENARIAVMLADILSCEFGFELSRDHVENGLEDARHPGRLEYVGDRYLLDGAHNVAGAEALAGFLNEFETRPITMIFGTMREKDIGQIASILFSKAANLILTTPDNSRAVPAPEISKLVGEVDRAHVTDNVAESMALANVLAGDGIVLATGSLYLVGDVMRIIHNTGDNL